MSKHILFPIIPEGTKCKNSKCKKDITVFSEYVHLCRPERTDPKTGKHEFFCCMECHTEHEKQERAIAHGHSCIRYLEYS